ncbi:EFR1 family ferrodoxin [Clostridium estertheticum]|uniref:EFR1 family ferrodoxin n=1 Tax=Clostridium estertheticum TaxID=238834 RepID=UPI001C0DAA97|nr:EFR1 family ferrodoxin [Clostridium estertheticum]MBU3174935.1 EFR1 family ferrodoxin [Clostridium estertheticum]
MKTTIFYFTGTGNCLAVAKELANGLEDTEIVQICRNNIKITSQKIYGNIGIVFPVYFRGLPLMVKELIKNIKIDKNSYVFSIATYGGSSGSPISILENILSKKGIKLSAAYKLLMPANHQTIHDPNPKEEQNELIRIQKENIVQIANDIKNNKIIKVKEQGKLFTTFINNYIITPNKINSLDKNFWTDEKCNSCGTCSKLCPANNIKMEAGNPKWQHQCESCLACLQWCPKQSIQYKKSTLKRDRYHHPEIKVHELFQKTSN